MTLPFTQKMQSKEAIVRGTYLSISCDFDRVMNEIVGLCEYYKIDSTLNKDGLSKYTFNKVRGLEMGTKFQRCKDAIFDLDQDIHNCNNGCFSIISKLITNRNLFAHGYSEYDPNNIDTSFITFMNKERSANIIKTVIVDDFIAELEQYRKMAMGLMYLNIIILNVLKGLIELSTAKNSFIEQQAAFIDNHRAFIFS